MRKGERRRMKGDPRKTEGGTVSRGRWACHHLLVDFPLARVERIPQKRVADGGKVDADLMEAARLRKYAHNASFARSKRINVVLRLLGAKDAIYAVFGDCPDAAGDVH